MLYVYACKEERSDAQYAVRSASATARLCERQHFAMDFLNALNDNDVPRAIFSIAARLAQLQYYLSEA
ncbi:hypothetical protein X798_01882 [Onchocerca flexuosa]|uniref:Uncharacterized protein n=2 Tax=Onchocerca flexuosa TaxID=387005 RepID=A0A183HDT0_9BILA|nr:hypothetical protein X798_01882 [Onchocerca flexuosa]VDO43829.1 unnamed protein product [Onchocerca flexuosa]